VRLLRRVNWLGLATVVALIALWHIMVATGVVNFDFVPGPGPVARALGDLASSGVLFDDLRHTLWVVLVSSVLAITIGFTIGSLIGLIPLVRTFSMATVDFLRSIPFVALIPITILLWGPETHTEVIIATYGASWAMIVNTANAYRNVNQQLGDVAKVFQLTRPDTFRKIWVPSIVPQALVGARLSVVSAMVLTVLAETFVNPAGLGWGLMLSKQALQSERMWAYALVIGWIGYLLNVALVHGTRALVPGGRKNPSLVGA
jgi:sulfonate transport system permease protein